ncbi:MAG TPA: hypothetical protein VIJ68_01460 [Candidatus Saccharimonadales bacterium]
MEFSNRNLQSPAPAPSAHPAAVGTPGTVNRKHNRSDKSKWFRVGAMLGLLAVVVLAVAAIIVLSTDTKTEDSYVDTGKLQAVFLNTGQVYFGNVQALNSKYFVLTNIYYLQTSNSSGSTAASTANSNVTLVKLGCELHRPYDKMVINRTSVTFWENLESTGQVAQAVTKFQQQNPNGQKCSDQSSSSGSTTNATQPANNSGSSATPATTSTTPSTTTTNP